MTTIGKTRRPVEPEARGVLRRLPAGEFTLERTAPCPALEEWVEHFWRVRWNLEGLPPQVQETLPHPNVHLVLEPGIAVAHGVFTGRWRRTLEGRSQAFGIKLRPGALRPLIQHPVSELADRSLPLAALFGAEAGALDAVLDCEAQADAVDVAQRFLLARLPAPDPQAVRAGRIVDSIVDDRELLTVARLAERCGLGVRALQRLFSDYVGTSPKWVIKRYRMHEAVARVQAGEPVAWAALAQDLGYFDQAHFIADFRRLVGRTPADYARAHAG
jgi:AraC-like DNA-binding protein